MLFCTHYRSELARNKKTPLAVPFGWFMLGVLLFISFDSALITIPALLIMLYNGYKLIKHLNLLVCCLRKRMREIQRTGEDPGACMVVSKS